MLHLTALLPELRLRKWHRQAAVNLAVVRRGMLITAQYGVQRYVARGVAASSATQWRK
jgi:hypothetical protein